MLLKQRLYTEYWALIIDKVDNTDKKTFLKGDFISVNGYQAIKRLKNLLDVKISKKDEETFKALKKKRNKIEHFKVNESSESLLAIIDNSLQFISNFIVEHFDSIRKDTHYSKIREIEEASISLKEQMDQREAEIQKKAENPDDLVICQECRKKCFNIENNVCLFCGHTMSPEELAYLYISEKLGISEYECFRHGEGWPQYTCPECGIESLIQIEDGSFRCFSCEETFESGNIDFCAHCQKPIRKKDYEMMSICQDCLDFIVLKDE